MIIFISVKFIFLNVITKKRKEYITVLGGLSTVLEDVD